MRTFRLWACVLLLALVSCIPKKQLTDDEPIDTSLPEFVFPLNVGNKWTYVAEGFYITADNDRQRYLYKDTVRLEIVERTQRLDTQFYRQKFQRVRISRLDVGTSNPFPPVPTKYDTLVSFSTIVKSRATIVDGEFRMTRYSDKYQGTTADTLEFSSGFGGRYSSINTHRYVNRIGKVYWTSEANVAASGEYKMIEYRLK